MPNPQGTNGYKVSPAPDILIRPLVEQFVADGYTNPEIVTKLKDYYDTDRYSFSLALLKKKRMVWGLKSARGQAHSVDSVGPTIERVRERFPHQGSHDMRVTLRQEERVMVPRQVILDYMNLHHPDEVKGRRKRRLKRSYFWTAGVNELWCFDQHDKWRRFQLFFHVGLEPFSGYVLWLKVWWTNHNPRLICGWYCDVVERLGGMPLITQSDPGTENNGIANGHTLLRHMQDPALDKTLQHTFKGSHRNIKPEIFWGQFRRRWAPGFEALLDWGVNEGLYDADDALQRLVFHYVFIPWIQQELNCFIERFNGSKPRRNSHKLLPHGRPVDIFKNPELFESRNFAVKVHPPYLTEVRDKYAPPDHPVFHLVPPAFSLQARTFWDAANYPQVGRENIWDIYLHLLQQFRDQPNNMELRTVMALSVNSNEEDESEFMPVMELPPHRQRRRVVGDAPQNTGGYSSDEADTDFEYEWTDDSD
ncbi:hypothetical protein SERLADRAFT_408531 [Serpula lacrymans var. lacrymans S7.9]|uniref:Integrase core domain-containing protein n=1 Tax=Serpula lacrymans var. lacrymans (strain S7.9) TaxID=578457 RepID=F8P557_SERL9|nr:uncharacterized protein SERLADRAFT_408531 [Serpula lacrymans var. lacrymans S7.9]XP_007321530.1 uncharacterized protein SERLADRAFT_410282 [Serpula lacrymans var. lacrymans S7.9]XP_007322032.1 uncharacterized protein SERLADRAFT_410591 [Serpula lacrymans var. lacrymans S7.9]XP_007322669.1 uncharacterized protein SERLADRAFT_410992 [Serpula lacrymans var. lacrymans S7.9]XP_007324794.1 uncharacterized protein SERLADRAFT_412221 [Serpula lacrymans var. lacrymans S7.9]EGO18514.1 hypothetical protei